MLRLAMRILFIGDVSARPGRNTIKQVLPALRKQENIDFVIANVENSAGGRGVTPAIIQELQGAGIDYFTTGEHVWDQQKFVEAMEIDEFPLVRPYNYEKQHLLPGKGYEIIDLKDRKLVIIALLGQEFMRQHVRSPFWVADELLGKLSEEGINPEEDIIIVDFHAEATSEKKTFGNYLKNRATAVLGTHTHVATADAHLLENTAYVTDVGMVGPYDSSLWVDFATATHNFKFPYRQRHQVDMNVPTIFNSVLIETEQGRAKSIVRLDKIVKN